MAAFTEAQAQIVAEAAEILDNATILDTLAKAIADNGGLLEEYDYLRQRVEYHKDYGKTLLQGVIGAELKEDAEE